MAKKTNETKKPQLHVSENIKLEFRPYENGNTLGFATVTFYDAITIYQCVIINGKNGPFLSMPQYKAKNGEYYNYCYLDKDDELSDELNSLLASMF